MKIGTKIFLVFFISGVALTIGGVYFFYHFSSEELTNAKKETLEATAISKANHIKSFLEEKKEDIEIAATHQELLNEELVEIRDINDEYYELFVLDSRGIIIASSDEDKIGLDRSDRDYFINARKETFIKDVYFPEENNTPALLFATAQNENILVARVKSKFLDEITLERDGLGETGEIYLINKEKKIITPSRFIEDAILNIEVDTINSRNCFSMKDHPTMHTEHGAVEFFKDYRGVEVMGTHVYIPEMDWCLLAEVDKKEAITPVSRLITISIVLIIVIILLVFIISFFFSRSISKPIKLLQKGTEIIAKGNLDYRVGINKNDEVGQLSQAFDKMVVAIRQSRERVDRRVKEQTRSIMETQKALKKQQGAILNVVEDVQEEKDLVQKERNRTEAILQGIGDGVFFVDKDLNIRIFNKIAEKISGFTAKEAIGKRYDKVLKFINEKDNKVNDKFIKDALSFGIITTMANHAELIRKNGIRVPVADSAAPLKDTRGRVIGCVVVFRDVTKEREIDKAKTEFVSLASHQLRTPLSTIKWYLEIVLDEANERLSVEEKDYLKEVYDSNERMIHLVGALLNVSRIELGTFAIAPKLVDVKRIVEQSLAEVLPEISKKKLKITKKINSKLPAIKVDPNLFKIVVDNLLTNAIKYTPEKGFVSLELSIKDKKELLIKVSDTGYGIPENQQKMIFEKLFRADNVRQQDTTGTGLGLYITKAIIEKSGGKIWFDSVVNKGSNFYATIPLEGMRVKKGTRKLE